MTLGFFVLEIQIFYIQPDSIRDREKLSTRSLSLEIFFILSRNVFITNRKVSLGFQQSVMIKSGEAHKMCITSG